MILKPCLGDPATGQACGQLSPYSRCDKHRRAKERYRGSASARGYDGNWRRLRAKVVKEWVDRHGWVCPGYRRPSHPSRDLTGDHIQGLIDGGRSEKANIAVLCRACNTAKSNDANNAARAQASGGGVGAQRGSAQPPRPWSRPSREKTEKTVNAPVFVR